MYLLVIFLYISGMKIFISFFIMLLTVGNISGFSKIIADLGKNSNEIVLISDYDQVIEDVNAIDFEMVALELRVIKEFNFKDRYSYNDIYFEMVDLDIRVIKDYRDRITILQKRNLNSNIKIKANYQVYRLNYHKARDKLRA